MKKYMTNKLLKMKSTPEMGVASDNILQKKKISELVDTAIKKFHNEIYREKYLFKKWTENYIWKHFKCPYTCIIGASEATDRGWTEKYFGEIMTEIFPKLMRI